jgi:hypothetical protein
VERTLSKGIFLLKNTVFWNVDLEKANTPKQKLTNCFEDAVEGIDGLPGGCGAPICTFEVIRLKRW